MVVVRDPRPEARELVAAARAALGLEELEERVSRGVFPFVRYGSSWRDLDRLSHLVSRHSPLVSIVADDIHALHLVAEGHLDRALRRALELGVDPVDAVRAVTLAPAMAYGFEAWMGSIAPGGSPTLCS